MLNPIEFHNNNDLKEAVRDYFGPNVRGLPPIESWDVSNVEDLSNIFENLITTHDRNDRVGGIVGWNIGNVQEMDYTFAGCTAFNQPIGGWDVRNVVNASSTFDGCENFNQPLDTWQLDNLDYAENMFRNCKSFNQPLGTWGFNTSQFNPFTDTGPARSKVRILRGMFAGCEELNQDFRSWILATIVVGRYRREVDTRGMFFNTPKLIHDNFPTRLVVNRDDLMAGGRKNKKSRHRKRKSTRSTRHVHKTKNSRPSKRIHTRRLRH